MSGRINKILARIATKHKKPRTIVRGAVIRIGHFSNHFLGDLRLVAELTT
jgi:hypothetical protein